MLNKTYTYAQFARDVMKMLDGDLPTDETTDLMKNKAINLLNQQITKINYNNAHKKPARGASEETQAKAKAIRSVLTKTPKTAFEIAAELKEDWSPLSISNAIRWIDNVTSTKVVRDVVIDDLKVQRRYTAYYIDN